MTPPTGRPENQPGQPYGQPGWTQGGPPAPPTPPPGTYPGRPAPRLSGFPLFCLGCAGLAVIAFIALAGFGYFFARKTMGPPITQATLASALPRGVPLYPRFTLVESGSREMNIPIPGRAGRTVPRMTMLTFTCPDPLATVGPWYQRALAPQGWTGGLSPKNPNQYMFQQAGTAIVLQETRQRRQQVITMMIARTPPGSTTPPPFPATSPPPGP